MEQWKLAVVTGASSGIGAAICETFAKNGINVVGLARRVDKIQALIAKNPGPGQIYAFKCDISDYASIKNAFTWIGEKFGVINILVNNAGVYYPTLILSDEDNVDKIKSTIDVNVTGLTLCTKEAYKYMKAVPNTPGYIININSISGHSTAFPVEYPLNVYPGSKHAVTAISDILRKELQFLKNPNVRITVSSVLSTKKFYLNSIFFSNRALVLVLWIHLFIQSIIEKCYWLNHISNQKILFIPSCIF